MKELTPDRGLYVCLPNSRMNPFTRNQPVIAQPDEVWNYRRGDGLEKAICLANVIRAREAGVPLKFEKVEGRVRLAVGGSGFYDFTTAKSVALPDEEDLG